MWRRLFYGFPLVLCLFGCASPGPRDISADQANAKDLTIGEKMGKNLPSDALEIAEAQKQRRLLVKMINIAAIMCQESYPPLSLDECFERIYTGMLSQGDQHTQYLNAKEFAEFKESNSNRYVGIGIQLGSAPSGVPTVSLVLPGSSAEKAGILPGDVITKVNGRSRAQFADMTALIKVIRGERGTTVTLTVAREKETEERQFTLVRDIVRTEQVKGSLIIDGTKVYGLLQTLHFGEDFAAEVQERYLALLAQYGRPLDGLIFSVEGNPGGLLPEAINAIDLFIDFPGPSPVLVRSASGVNVYGQQPDEKKALKHTPGDITNGIPMLVIINEGSASASELFASALKHFGRATIAGPSAGTYQKGVIQNIRQVDPASAVKFTSGEYLVGTPDDWVAVQCYGVTPDIMIGSTNDTRAHGGECSHPRSAATGGQMKDPPKRRPIQEARPDHFSIAEDMVSAYMRWKAADRAEKKEQK